MPISNVFRQNEQGDDDGENQPSSDRKGLPFPNWPLAVGFVFVDPNGKPNHFDDSALFTSLSL